MTVLDLTPVRPDMNDTPHPKVGPLAVTHIAELSERSRDIFRNIVESYLETGEPVGSRTLSQRGTIPLSPASIRNVMSDLTAAPVASQPSWACVFLWTDCWKLVI
jgi:heat-inducible transcriptional repressor